MRSVRGWGGTVAGEGHLGSSADDTDTWCHQVRMEFAYDGGGLAKGGTATLFVDGQQVGQGRVEATVPMLFSADETADLGSDTGSPVADDYPADPHFSGTIAWVQLEIGPDDQDHLITAEERLRVAMSRQ